MYAALSHASGIALSEKIHPAIDTLPLGDSLLYPLQDRRSDKISLSKKNPFDLKDPVNLKDSLAYDYKTKEYYINRKDWKQVFQKTNFFDF